MTVHDDTASVISAIHRLATANTVEDAWDTLTRAMKSYGFDRLFYGLTRFNTENSVGDRDDLLLLSSMPEDYMQRYVGEDMYRDAPMTTWARQNAGAMSWSWISENMEQMGPRQLKVLEFNQEFGVTAGYTIAFKDAQTRYKGAIALTAREGLSQSDVDALWEVYGLEINSLNQVAHLRLAGLPLSLIHI